jgi:hypothetical protein
MIAGIDAGLKGGIVILSSKGELKGAYRMPLHTKTKRLDLKRIRELLQSIWFIGLEEQFINPKQQGQFTNARNYGELYTSCVLSGASVKEWRPKEWQGLYRFPYRKTKRHHIELALRLCPKLADHLTKKNGELNMSADGIADAYLIARAEFKRLQMVGEL